MANIVNVPLEVTVVGQTVSNYQEIQDIYDQANGSYRDRDENLNGLPLIELAGRGCYEAYGRNHEKTDSHEGYVSNILTQKHYSVLEHVTYSFHVKGISRAESHEIVRHRHLGFSQQSQRFCVVKEPYEVALHPTLLEMYDEEVLLDHLAGSFIEAEAVYRDARERGYDRKPASEAARAFLPNAAATHMVVTGNLRSWIEFISKRDHEAADAGIRRVAQEIHAILKEDLPEIFSDEARAIWDEEFAQGKVQHVAK